MSTFAAAGHSQELHRRKGSHHSCRLRLQYRLQAPAVRLRCRLPPLHAIASPVAWFPFAPDDKLVLQRVVRRFATAGLEPSAPLPRFKSDRPRPPSLPAAVTGHHQGPCCPAPGQLLAILVREIWLISSTFFSGGTPRPVLCVLSPLHVATPLPQGYTRPPTRAAAALPRRTPQPGLNSG